jgi:hypothetical protein
MLLARNALVGNDHRLVSLASVQCAAKTARKMEWKMSKTESAPVGSNLHMVFRVNVQRAVKDARQLI